MSKPLISVIVPVYNAEIYLDRCVHSLLSQDYENMEIILVDDGSTDNSPVICDKYAERYSNILVYHKKNGGQSSARNVGLCQAKGEYVGFVDSDDWVAKDMYSYLYSLIENYDADISSIWFKCCNSEDDISINVKENIKVLRGKEILVDHLREALKSGSHSVCRCLFKKDICEKLCFPEGYFNEDLPFKFAVLAKAKTYVSSNLVKYYYFQGGISTTRGAFKLKDLDLMEMSNRLYDLANPYGGEIEYLARVKKYRADFSIISRIAYYGSQESKNKTISVINVCVNRLRRNYIFLAKSPMPISRKIIMSLFCIRFCVGEKIVSFAKKIRT